MKDEPIELKPELKDRAIQFFTGHSQELEQIKKLLQIKLTQICLAYTTQHHLPQEALWVTARTKKLNSLLTKLERKGWPPFSHPAEVIHDLVGARITCWFLNDCHGILTAINRSEHFEVVEKSVEDYINHPKLSGYRGLHLLTNVSYDKVQRNEAGEITLAVGKMICEIQIRTRLQDAWGDMTHDLYYRAKNLQLDDSKNHPFLSAISNRFLQEDIALLKLRALYQDLAVSNQPFAKG